MKLAVDMGHFLAEHVGASQTPMVADMMLETANIYQENPRNLCAYRTGALRGLCG